jgi:dienelactone hydrolase
MILKMTIAALFFVGQNALAWTSHVTYQTTKGLQIDSIVAAPSDPGILNKKLPVLIFEQGDATADLVSNDRFAPTQMITQLEQASIGSGFIWAVPELRRQASVGRPLEICELDFHHREGDLLNYIERIKTLPFVDTARIFLMGHSAGADTVTHVAQQSTDIRGIINLAGGVSSCGETSVNCPVGLTELVSYVCTETEHRGRTGLWWQQLFLDSRLTASISRLAQPYLAMIGDQDEVVSPTEFRRAAAEIAKLRAGFQAVVLPGVSHGNIVMSPKSFKLITDFVNQTQ